MSRKYRQRGYQDDDRSESRGGKSKGPRPRREGPRGRGMGAPTETLMRCHACGAEIYKTDVAKADTCACGAELHSCVNCRHFDPSATFECRQPIKERIPKKSKANDCDLYEPKLVQEFESGPRKDGDARAAFDNLFDL